MYTPSHTFDFTIGDYTPTRDFNFSQYPDVTLNYILDNVITDLNGYFAPTITSGSIGYTLLEVSPVFNVNIANLGILNYTLDPVSSNIVVTNKTVSKCNLNYTLNDFNLIKSEHSTNVNDYTRVLPLPTVITFDRYVDIFYGSPSEAAFKYNVIGEVNISNLPLTYGTGFVTYLYFRELSHSISCVVANDSSLNFMLSGVAYNIDCDSLPVTAASVNYILNSDSYNFIPVVGNDSTLNHILADFSYNIHLEQTQANNIILNYTLDDMLPAISTEYVGIDGVTLNYNLGEVVTHLSSVLSNDSHLNYKLGDFIITVPTVYFGYRGCVSNCEIEIYSLMPTQIGYNGYNGYSEIYSNAVILDFKGYYGNYNTLDLGVLNNITSICYTGNECNTTIRTTSALPFDGHFGLFATAQIVKQNLHILSFKGFLGRQGALNYPDDTIVFDLDLASCCYINGKLPHHGETWDIDLGKADFYDENFNNKTKKLISVNIATRSRFTFLGQRGNILSIQGDEPFTFIKEAVKGYRGNSCYVEFQAVDYIKLCKGSFIPDSEVVNVELADTLVENCGGLLVGNRGYNATIMISSFYKFMFPTIPVGRVATVNIVTIPPTAYIASRGYTTVTHISTKQMLDFKGYRGSGGKLLGFKGEIYTAYRGCVGVLGELQEKIGVQIEDSGDLQNEYIYVDKNGDAIKELFTQEVIEGYPYSHWISAKCTR